MAFQQRQSGCSTTGLSQRLPVQQHIFAWHSRWSNRNGNFQVHEWMPFHQHFPWQNFNFPSTSGIVVWWKMTMWWNAQSADNSSDFRKISAECSWNALPVAINSDPTFDSAASAPTLPGDCSSQYLKHHMQSLVQFTNDYFRIEKSSTPHLLYLLLRFFTGHKLLSYPLIPI